MKNLLTLWEPRRKIGRPMRISYPCRDANKSHKRIMLLVKNLPTQWRETQEENQLNQSMKKALKQNDK